MGFRGRSDVRNVVTRFASVVVLRSRLASYGDLVLKAVSVNRPH